MARYAGGRCLPIGESVGSRWKGNVRNGRHIGCRLGDRPLCPQAGGKVMCDVEQAALAKAIADLKLTNANARGVRADVSLKAQL